MRILICVFLATKNFIYTARPPTPFPIKSRTTIPSHDKIVEYFKLADNVSSKKQMFETNDSCKTSENTYIQTGESSNLQNGTKNGIKSIKKIYFEKIKDNPEFNSHAKYTKLCPEKEIKSVNNPVENKRKTSRVTFQLSNDSSEEEHKPIETKRLYETDF